MSDKQLSFSSYHLKYDPEQHAAAWGARLIWDEVVAGGRGLVPGRQDAIGEQELVHSIWPTIDALVSIVRAKAQSWQLSAASDDKLELRQGKVVAVASPQGSYGYLYVTGVVER